MAVARIHPVNRSRRGLNGVLIRFKIGRQSDPRKREGRGQHRLKKKTKGKKKRHFEKSGNCIDDISLQNASNR